MSHKDARALLCPALASTVMSTGTARARIKAKEKLGVVKKSSNQRIADAVANFVTVEIAAEKLEAEFDVFLHSLQAFSDASSHLTEGITRYYEPAPSNQKSRADVFAEIHDAVDVTIPARMAGIAEEVVLSKFKAWTADRGEIRAELKEFESVRALFDHYQRSAPPLPAPRPSRTRLTFRSGDGRPGRAAHRPHGALALFALAEK